ncbi:MAG: dihydrolipoamide acetyltransferase family protein [Steroidobacteraceae bacterium]
MSRFVFRMPDLGEGTVEAEVVEWKVKVGDEVEEDSIIAEVMTDKAAVEVPAPVSGRVVSLTGGPGDMVAVGAELAVFEVAGDGEVQETPAAVAAPAAGQVAPAEAAPAASRVMTSPAIRRKAREAGIDLTTVAGSGPGGRITAGDLESYRSEGPAVAVQAASPAQAARREAVEEIKVIGLRRLIAQRMSEAKRNIPHFAYVEEVDVTELEALRVHLNGRLPAGVERYTLLPFIALGLARVLADYPQCNAHYDESRGVLLRHAGVHLGIATQTPEGLKVPVVRHAETLTLAGMSAAISAAALAARSGKASRDQLSGSTITLTSLGKLGGIVSTPIINAPEMAIIGVNRAVERPMVHNGSITIRRMMNLSSSFDHRFVDGHDAAAMIQALKGRLEHPATLFIQD